MDDKLLDAAAQIQGFQESLVEQLNQNIALRTENAKLKHKLRELDAANVQSQDA